MVQGEASEWIKVSSGVPQGSVLGPLLFLIYINDLDINIVSSLSKFADDTKLMHEISSIEDANQLQLDLHTLYDWAEEWQMMFNLDKCKVMHLGNKTVLETHQVYNMGGSLLKVVDEEKDLGVIVNRSLKPSRQCTEAAKKRTWS